MSHVTRTGPRPASHSLGPLPPEGPGLCVSTIVQTGGHSQDQPFSALLSCSCPPSQPPSQVPRRAYSYLEGPASAQETSCQTGSWVGASLYKARRQSLVQLPSGSPQSPRPPTESRATIMGKLRHVGGLWVLPIPAGPWPGFLPEGWWQAPGTATNQRRAVPRDRVAPFCLRGTLQSTDSWRTLGSIISSFWVLVSSHLPGRFEPGDYQVSFLL